VVEHVFVGIGLSPPIFCTSPCKNRAYPQRREKRLVSQNSKLSNDVVQSRHTSSKQLVPAWWRVEEGHRAAACSLKEDGVPDGGWMGVSREGRQSSQAVVARPVEPATHVIGSRRRFHQVSARGWSRAFTIFGPKEGRRRSAAAHFTFLVAEA
jgi:hypothetical protein